MTGMVDKWIVKFNYVHVNHYSEVKPDCATLCARFWPSILKNKKLIWNVFFILF